MYFHILTLLTAAPEAADSAGTAPVWPSTARLQTRVSCDAHSLTRRRTRWELDGRKKPGVTDRCVSPHTVGPHPRKRDSRLREEGRKETQKGAVLLGVVSEYRVRVVLLTATVLAPFSQPKLVKVQRRAGTQHPASAREDRPNDIVVAVL